MVEASSAPFSTSFPPTAYPSVRSGHDFPLILVAPLVFGPKFAYLEGDNDLLTSGKIFFKKFPSLE